jgi:hypothetical protein
LRAIPLSRGYRETRFYLLEVQMSAPTTTPDLRRRDSRKRQALVGVRLSPEELATLKTVAAREGLTLPGALREGFLRHVAQAR